ncbi:protein kinase-like domain-containing protein [Xylariomycetidae sp. FL2044]|nr:protein kinase-like domain-containing protein [Xylariomycetidae sp. FL2044]
MSTVSVTPRPNEAEPFAPGTLIRGDSGRDYEVEGILSGRRRPLLCVYRARAEGRKYVIKNMIKGKFGYQMDLQKLVSSSPNVRTMVDANRDLDVFIYPYLNGHLLHFSQRKLEVETRKDILRRALRGLVDLHERSIAHNDIKPNNILIDYDECPGDGVIVKSVQIADLDDGLILPPGTYVQGALWGNQLWRSPESWARAAQNQASDVFSFAIVMIYVMEDRMVFLVPNDQLNAEDSWRYIFRRHISFFADQEGIDGLMKLIGEEDPFYDRIIEVAGTFSTRDDGRTPFELRKDIDPVFQELVVKMTRLDPALRITAREALDHPWFAQA